LNVRVDGVDGGYRENRFMVPAREWSEHNSSVNGMGTLNHSDKASQLRNNENKSEALVWRVATSEKINNSGKTRSDQKSYLTVNGEGGSIIETLRVSVR